MKPPDVIMIGSTERDKELDSKIDGFLILADFAFDRRDMYLYGRAISAAFQLIKEKIKTL